MVGGIGLLTISVDEDSPSLIVRDAKGSAQNGRKERWSGSIQGFRCGVKDHASNVQLDDVGIVRVLEKRRRCLLATVLSQNV